jgi:uncharacterized protein HemX
MEDKDFWRTAGAVALGILVAGAVAFGVRIWMVNLALKEVQQTITASSNQMIESAQRSAERLRQEQEERQTRALMLEQQRKQEEAARQRAIYQAQQSVIDEQRVREDAWTRYYKKPAHCDQAEGNAFVECSNHYIRAKRKFDELYASGKL